MNVSFEEMAYFCHVHYRHQRLAAQGAKYVASVIAGQLEAIALRGESYVSRWESCNGEPLHFTAADVKDCLTTGATVKESLTVPTIQPDLMVGATCNDNLQVPCAACGGEEYWAEGPGYVRCRECAELAA